MAGDLEAAVLAAEKARCDAMLANDNAALDALLDTRLHFAHATGAVDDKNAFLAKMAAGRIRYVAIGWSEERILELAPGVAMLNGRMNTDVEVEGVAKQLRNRVMTVWSRTDDAWRMVAFQSTPLAG
ncbi:MAG: nuclear transport factor 2 family protein [Novosphingobium sp.]|nr:nuclear transport factor 2 family protein [Novosphingobium sp.]